MSVWARRSPCSPIFFQKPFLAKEMSVVVLELDDQNLIHRRLFTEIELGIIKDATRQEPLSVAKRMIDHQWIKSLILGCTELPLVLTKDEFGIPLLDTTADHAEAMVLYSLGFNAYSS